MVLIDNSFKNKAPIKELPFITWFGVYFKFSSGDSFWDPIETDTLDKIDDDLISLIDKFGHGWVVYVFQINTPGIREYFLYHGEHAELNKAFSALKELHSSYKMEFETKKDEKWEEYFKYISLR